MSEQQQQQNEQQPENGPRSLAKKCVTVTPRHLSKIIWLLCSQFGNARVRRARDLLDLSLFLWPISTTIDGDVPLNGI